MQNIFEKVCRIKIRLYICINKNGKTMTTLKNTTGSKAVNITTDGTGNVRAMYVQVYNGEQQVLQSKTFATTKNAEKWAKKILN